jgi:hypothetical protein
MAIRTGIRIEFLTNSVNSQGRRLSAAAFGSTTAKGLKNRP